jgi:hypothetical protein
MTREPITIEGVSPEDLLASLTEETEALVFAGRAIVFQMGTARILGEFSIETLALDGAVPDAGVP